MKNPSIRIIAIVLIAASALLVHAEAQAPPTPAYVEKGTGISFPVRIGLLAFEGVEEYEDVRYGVAIKYSAIGVAATLYVYNAGQKAIPSGVESPIHKDAMDMAVNDIREVAKQGQYQDVAFSRQEIADLAGSGSGTGTGQRARHVSLSYTSDGTSWHSHVFVLGHKNQLLKLRFSYVDGLRTTGEEQLKVLTKWLNDAMK
jgi:hypothetical protein